MDNFIRINKFVWINLQHVNAVVWNPTTGRFQLEIWGKGNYFVDDEYAGPFKPAIELTS